MGGKNPRQRRWARLRNPNSMDNFPWNSPSPDSPAPHVFTQVRQPPPLPSRLTNVSPDAPIPSHVTGPVQIQPPPFYLDHSVTSSPDSATVTTPHSSEQVADHNTDRSGKVSSFAREIHEVFDLLSTSLAAARRTTILHMSPTTLSRILATHLCDLCVNRWVGEERRTRVKEEKGDDKTKGWEKEGVI